MTDDPDNTIEAPKPKRKNTLPPDRRRERIIKGIKVGEAYLSPQQEAYCRARAMGMTPKEAVAAIGDSVSYKVVTAWERTVPKVRARIEQLAKIATENAILKTGLDREYVLTRLMGVVDRCMQAEPVLDRHGNPIGEYRFDSSGANAALRMLGDTLGMFKPPEKNPGDEYANLTDEDLARIASELAAQTGLIAHFAGTEEAAGSQQAIEVQAVPKAD